MKVARILVVAAACIVIIALLLGSAMGPADDFLAWFFFAVVLIGSYFYPLQLVARERVSKRIADDLRKCGYTIESPPRLRRETSYLAWCIEQHLDPQKVADCVTER